MQIRHRLLFLYLGMTALIIMMGVYTIYSTASILKNLESGGAQYRAITQAANEASSYAKRTQGHLMLYLTLGDQVDKDKFYNRHAALLEQVNLLQSAIMDPDVKEHLDPIRVQTNNLLLVGQSLLDAYDNNPRVNGTFDFQANAQAIRQLDQVAANIRQQGVDLANHEINLQDAVVQKSIQQNNNFKRNIITLIIIVIIITNIMAFFTTGSIAKPLDQIKDAANKIARGDRTVQTNIHAKNEIGALAKAFDNMAHEVDERRSELEVVHEEERKQRLELEEESKARAQFINVLAHEMRTPLTPLMLSIETIADSLNARPESAQYKLVNTARRSVDSLKNRLEELLELARFTRGAFKLNIQQIDTGEMVQRICAGYLPVMEQKNQCLNLEIGANLPQVEADLPRIEQVFVNLLSNASKYAPQNSEIHVNARVRNQQILIEIIDQGIGISEEDQKKLFMPYHRVEQDRQQFPGIGLGLAVSKQIIEAHHGRIWVESGLGKGCKFSFLLPLLYQEENGDVKA
jgi:signal transduction histidine kinase